MLYTQKQLIIFIYLLIAVAPLSACGIPEFWEPESGIHARQDEPPVKSKKSHPIEKRPHSPAALTPLGLSLRKFLYQQGKSPVSIQSLAMHIINNTPEESVSLDPISDDSVLDDFVLGDSVLGDANRN